MPDFILASKSHIRADLLTRIGLPFTVQTAPVDEDTIKASLLAEGYKPRDIADALAEAKAGRMATKRPDALVLGADQVLDLDGAILSKAKTRDEAADHLSRLSGKAHKLYSAAVIFHEARPIWRHIGEARLTMHHLSDAFIADYLDRTWDQVQYCVGCYQVEAEGAGLFSQISGDYFSILGLPLLPLQTFLIDRGEIIR
jgi:septum formation protein